ncbi:MAG: cytochrome C oxidase subunit II [Nitrospirae bacterium]|nr:cytochrome C oxidase subunit II [Nitrospirota bacterium]
MIESSQVMGLMKVVYVIYLLIVFSLMGMYAMKITKTGSEFQKANIFFYGWVGLLVCTGVGVHILTFNKIPWVKWDINRAAINAEREFNITIADYKFKLPEERLLIKKGDMVRFDIASEDHTYGFGVFREDGSMVFQMQVVPGSRNDIVWKFESPGAYSIRSTEYSGPKGSALLVKNVVFVATEKEFARLDKELRQKQDIYKRR